MHNCSKPAGTIVEMGARRRIAFVVSHPIQYLVPLYQKLAGRDDTEVKVFLHLACGRARGRRSGIWQADRLGHSARGRLRFRVGAQCRVRPGNAQIPRTAQPHTARSRHGMAARHRAYQRLGLAVASAIAAWVEKARHTDAVLRRLAPVGRQNQWAALVDQIGRAAQNLFLADRLPVRGFGQPRLFRNFWCAAGAALSLSACDRRGQIRRTGRAAGGRGRTLALRARHWRGPQGFALCRKVRAEKAPDGADAGVCSIAGSLRSCW